MATAHAGPAGTATSSTPFLDGMAAQFRAEQPKLDKAVKNYMMYHAALTMSSGDEHPAVAKPVHALTLARYVLNGLNDASLLPDPVEFGARHPQPEQQPGFDRLDELARYKVAYAVGAKLQQQGHKRTQFFGTYVRALCAFRGAYAGRMIASPSTFVS
jgi:hypothetical protein